jgi:serine/threonine-protein kinase
MGEDKQPLDFRFGYLAVQQGFVSMEQIKECVRVKSELEASGIDLKLGEILVRKGYMNGDQVDLILRSQTKRAPSQVIGGFQLEKKLGEGAMGAVYKAKQVNLDRHVALKVLPKRLARNQEFVARFQREARMVARLDHPNIVRGIDVGEQDGIHYLAMEFIEGESVGSILGRDGRLPWKSAVRFALDTARALEHAHSKGILHRDIKPDNILVEARSGVAKLTDMGLGDAVGTPNYISPEQARGAEELDARTDIYSLGATLYHMLTGTPPFKGNSAAHVMTLHITQPLDPPTNREPSVPTALSDLIEEMMAKDPDERVQSASELVQAFDGMLKGAETVATPRASGRRATANGGKGVRIGNKSRGAAAAIASRRRPRASDDPDSSGHARRRKPRRSIVGTLFLFFFVWVLLLGAGGAVYALVIEGWTIGQIERWVTLGKPPWAEENKSSEDLFGDPTTDTATDAPSAPDASPDVVDTRNTP